MYPQGTYRPMIALSDLREHKLDGTQLLENWWLIFAIFLLLRGKAALTTGSGLALWDSSRDYVSSGPFSGTLNCPVHAVTHVLSSFAFGRGKKGDKWQRMNSATLS